MKIRNACLLLSLGTRCVLDWHQEMKWREHSEGARTCLKLNLLINHSDLKRKTQKKT